MYTPVNPSFTIYKWGLRGSKLYGHVFVMETWSLWNALIQIDMRINEIWSCLCIQSYSAWTLNFDVAKGVDLNQVVQMYRSICVFAVYKLVCDKGYFSFSQFNGLWAKGNGSSFHLITTEISLTFFFKAYIGNYHTKGQFSRRQTGDFFLFFLEIGSEAPCKLSP